MFITRKLTTTLLRHLFSIGVTTLAPYLIFLLFGLWWFTVLAIAGTPATTDDTFVLSDFLKELLLVWVVFPIFIGAIFSTLFIFPPALLLEWFASKFKILVIAVPVGLILTSAGGLVLHDLWIKFERPFQLLDDFIGWIGTLSFILFVYSIPFSLYWSVLWFGRAIVHSLRLGIKILFYAIIGGKGKSDLATHSSV